jgi:dihydrofolate reductase
MVSLYIASSLDGYIATATDGLEWLPKPNPNQDFGYKEFLSHHDFLVMGASTYLIINDFGPWEYNDKITYVLTTNPPNVDYGGKILFVDVETLEGILNSKKDKNIWLVGGGKLNQLFLEKDWIDSIILTIIPIELGEGKPLFSKTSAEEALDRFEQVFIQDFQDGIQQITYKRK